uniref:Formin FH3 domain-containing protein n=1 Tax=Romanomermis culicivorax TaxID=13658 RepID=A0A915JGM2_ROMCU
MEDVKAIGSEKFAVRSNAVQLLSALAYFSEQGCQVILDGLMRFQQKSSKKFWTEILVDELSQNSADIDYKASLMALINCIMFNVHVDKRSKIRNEFLGR